MSSFLFEEIHDDAYLCERSTPATIEEFIAFGLQPEDYLRYIGLQQRLQSDLILSGTLVNCFPSGSEKPIHSSLEEFITFCFDKRLIYSDDYYHSVNNLFHYAGLFDRFDAAYYHEWLQYPMEPSNFRLIVERKLSRWWDEEDAYITGTFGIISFYRDQYVENPNGSRTVAFDSPMRIKRFNPESKDFSVLRHSEIRALYSVAQSERNKIEEEIASHLAQMPSKRDVPAITEGLPWVKRMYALYDRQEIVESVFDQIGEALNAPDLYLFKDSDTLFVYCQSNSCKIWGHSLSDRLVEFSFYGKPNKQYTITWCNNCQQFQISLQDLIAMFDSYGVPRGKIIYDDDTSGDFSEFAETSIFYDMGYTVSQSANLSAARRQMILKYAITSGKASKKQVLYFLQQRMNINGMKPGNEIAFRKWKEDYEYVLQL